MDPRAQEILDYWLDEIGPKRWYDPDEALDAEIRSRFGALWEDACAGRADRWASQAHGSLALAILLDQFPRNLFRGSAEAFATDAKALAIAKSAIARGFDERIEMPARQFFYLPLMHSEVLADQERAVRLFALAGGGENLAHARAHREIIRRYGRFPYRNAALGRTTTPKEQAFLDAGGYSAMMREFGL